MRVRAAARHRVADRQHDDRDVVLSTRIQCQVDQTVGRGLRILLLSQHSGDVVVGDHRGEPVRADEHAVAVLQIDGREVDVHLAVDAERARDDAPLRMSFRLLLGQSPLAHHATHECVVLSQLLQRAIPEEIGARIPDVRDVGAPVVEHQQGARRPHAMQRVVVLGAAEDRAVGLAQHLRERLRVRRVGVTQAVGDDVDRGRGGDIAGQMTTHAVGDREQRLLDQVGVFVALADPARVGAGAPGCVHFRSSRTVLPIFTLSPRVTFVGEVILLRFTYVPLVEPMSSTTTPSSLVKMRACICET